MTNSNRPSMPLKVYVRPMSSGGWGIFRPLDRRPLHGATMLTDAIAIARRYGNDVLVMNESGKVVRHA